MFARTIAASILIVLLAALATGVSAERPVYTQAAVFWNTIQERDAILQAFPNLDIMKVKPGHAFIIVTDPDEIAEIEARGFRTETMIEDMERFYSSRLKGNNFGDFHTYSEATAYLDSMHTEHPDITTAKVSLGQTEEGRDIWAIKISDNPASQENEPEVLFDALHHAREVITPEVVLDFIRYLCDGYGNDPVATYLVDERQIWIVPVVNPDGFCYNESTHPSGGGMWRKNRRDMGSCHGVDINRNYPYMWGQGGSSTDPCDDLYMGPSAGSEPEVQALMAFMNDHEFVTHNSYHSVAAVVLVPWSYTTDDTPDHATFMAMGQAMGAPAGYPAGQAGEPDILDYNASGTTFDWSYGEQTTKPKVMAFTTEVGGTGFWPAESELPGLVAENLPANIYLAQAAGAYVRVADVAVTDDVKGDGKLDPGESAHLTLTLENVGVAEGLADIDVILRSYDPYIHVSDAFSDFGAFAAREVKDNASDPFQITVDAACPDGHPTTFYFDVYAGGSLFARESHNLTIGSFQVAFLDDFESGTGNWTFTGGTWGLVTSTYASPTHSITDSPSGDYANYINSRMVLLDGLDLSDYDDACLEFQHRYEIENGYDFGYVEMNVDDGGWTRLGTPFTGFQTTWTEASRSLAEGCGHADVKFRFRLQSDTYVTEDGWYIDDVAVSVAGAANHAPTTPSPTSPVAGVVVGTAKPTLVVLNSADEDPGSTLTYGFEVYADSLLTQLVTSASGVAEGTDFTSWIVDIALEDGTYWWRAWADDGAESGLCPNPASFAVEAPTGVAELGGSTGLRVVLAAEPNPFSDWTRIGFSIPSAGDVNVSVYDVAGRRVNRLVSGVLEAGTHGVVWDGRDESGHATAGGVYFCRIEAAGRQYSVKLMRVR